MNLTIPALIIGALTITSTQDNYLTDIKFDESKSYQLNLKQGKTSFIFTGSKHGFTPNCIVNIEGSMPNMLVINQISNRLEVTFYSKPEIISYTNFLGDVTYTVVNLNLNQ